MANGLEQINPNRFKSVQDVYGKSDPIDKLLRVMSAYGESDKEAHAKYYNQASLYEQLIGKATTPEQIDALMPALAKLDTENKGYGDDLDQFDIYLATTAKNKGETLKAGRIAYDKMAKRYNDNKNLTEEQFTAQIFGDPKTGVKPMNVIELSQYKDNLTLEKDALKAATDTGAKYSRELPADFLVGKYDTYIQQIDAAVQNQMQNSIKNFNNLSGADRDALEQVHNNIWASVYAGQPEVTKQLIQEQKGILESNYSRTRGEADNMKGIINRYFTGIDDTVLDLKDMGDSQLSDLAGGGDTALFEQLQAIRDNVGMITRVQALEFFQDYKDQAKTYNTLFKGYTGEYLAQDYTEQDDIEWEFQQLMKGSTGGGGSGAGSGGGAGANTNKSNIINNTVSLGTPASLEIDLGPAEKGTTTFPNPNILVEGESKIQTALKKNTSSSDFQSSVRGSTAKLISGETIEIDSVDNNKGIVRAKNKKSYKIEELMIESIDNTRPKLKKANGKFYFFNPLSNTYDIFDSAHSKSFDYEKMLKGGKMTDVPVIKYKGQTLYIWHKGSWKLKRSMK